MNCNDLKKFDFVDRRNYRLKLYMSFLFGEENITVSGDVNSPYILYKDSFVLSAYVKNFYLRLVDGPMQGEILSEVKLLASPNIENLVNAVSYWLENSTHRKVFKIKLKGTDLFLSGYNFLDPEHKLDRYPVFSKHKPRIYFDIESAFGVITQYEKEYDLEIVEPTLDQMPTLVESVTYDAHRLVNDHTLSNFILECNIHVYTGGEEHSNALKFLDAMPLLLANPEKSKAIIKVKN